MVYKKPYTRISPFRPPVANIKVVYVTAYQRMANNPPLSLVQVGLFIEPEA